MEGLNRVNEVSLNKFVHVFLLDTCSKGQIGHASTRGQDGDFNMPVGLIPRARDKRLKKSFGNLAKSIVKEMHQEWAKIQHDNFLQPKILLFAMIWAKNLIQAILSYSLILALFSLVSLSI